MRNLTQASNEAKKTPEFNSICHKCFALLDSFSDTYKNNIKQFETALQKASSSGKSQSDIEEDLTFQREIHERTLERSLKCFDHCNDECIVDYKEMFKNGNCDRKEVHPFLKEVEDAMECSVTR